MFNQIRLYWFSAAPPPVSGRGSACKSGTGSGRNAGLHNHFQTLAEYRYIQGLKTAIFTTLWIYDTYSDIVNGSLPHVDEFPKRIRGFLKDMYSYHGNRI